MREIIQVDVGLVPDVTYEHGSPPCIDVSTYLQVRTGAEVLRITRYVVLPDSFLT